MHIVLQRIRIRMFNRVYTYNLNEKYQNNVFN